MNSRTRTAMAAALLGLGLCLGPAGDSRAQEDEPAGEAPAKQAVPTPPFAWLAPYAQQPTDADAFDRIRTDLLRMEDDRDVVHGLSWLVHAKSREVRSMAARALASAYMLGAHLDADPVPAVRAFARDPDAVVRRSVVSELGMHDSPLAREILLLHHTGEIPFPEGEHANAVRKVVQKLLPRYATRGEWRELGKATAFDRQTWFDGGVDRPATRTSRRFETGVVRIGQDHAIELTNAPGTYFWVESVKLVRGKDGRVGSGDSIMSFLGVPDGGRCGEGVAVPYSGGISLIGQASFERAVRFVGDDRVRYWVRADPTGRAIEHHSR